MSPPNGMKGVISFYGDNKVTELSKGNCKGNPIWEHDNLIVIRGIVSAPAVQLHHAIAPLFTECLKTAMSRCPRYEITLLGGYCARHQRNDPNLPLSLHSYGAAFDINWNANPMGKRLVTDIPPDFVSAFKEKGWVWGGDWTGIKDPMHFQFATGC